MDGGSLQLRPEEKTESADDGRVNESSRTNCHSCLVPPRKEEVLVENESGKDETAERREEGDEAAYYPIAHVSGQPGGARREDQHPSQDEYGLPARPARRDFEAWNGFLTPHRHARLQISWLMLGVCTCRLFSRSRCLD